MISPLKTGVVWVSLDRTSLKRGGIAQNDFGFLIERR
jgi:hypothetical protein